MMFKTCQAIMGDRQYWRYETNRLSQDRLFDCASRYFLPLLSCLTMAVHHICCILQSSHLLPASS